MAGTTLLDHLDTAAAALVDDPRPIVQQSLAHVRRRHGSTEQFLAATAAQRAMRARRSPLTTRQHQVLSLLAGGSSTTEVAAVLGVGQRTVVRERSRITAALGARSFTEALAVALRTGLMAEQR
jgi:DNA-binding NarL/FixJ family response regulator